MAKGMQRSDFEGFRYKPRETMWIRGNEGDDNFALKREFENIGVLVEKIGGAIQTLAGDVYGPNGIGGGSDTDQDESVRLSLSDPFAGHLLEKLVAGPGIAFNVIQGSKGLALEISAAHGADMIVCVHDFNTYINKDGSPRTGDQRLEETFTHPIMNEHYLFEVYRPFEDRTTTPVDKWPDGTIRGRYHIRWKNVIHKEAGRFGLRFHQPEYGTIVLYGSSAVLRV